MHGITILIFGQKLISVLLQHLLNVLSTFVVNNSYICILGARLQLLTFHLNNAYISNGIITILTLLL